MNTVKILVEIIIVSLLVDHLPWLSKIFCKKRNVTTEWEFYFTSVVAILQLEVKVLSALDIKMFQSVMYCK